MRAPPSTLFPLLAAVGLLAAACGSAAGGGASTDGSTGGADRRAQRLPTGPRGGELPPLDRSLHSVPLDRVVFDTFLGGSVPLPEADAGLIERLRDVIPPIDDPIYEGPAGGDWLEPDDLVLGYIDGAGVAYAYPVKILNFHEIVNDELAGVPVLVSYCPLCRSGVVYDRRLDDRELTFGNTSALFDSDLVMYDHQSNSYWWQVAGEAIVGTLTGQRLTPLPSVMRPWEEWRVLHPQTRVLSQYTGYVRTYEQDPFAGLGEHLNRGGATPFPVDEEANNPRLDPGELVLGIEVGGVPRVYPLERLGDAAIVEELGGRRVVVLAGGGTGGAFVAEAGGRALTLEAIPPGAREGEPGRYRDLETGSSWDRAGRALDGPLSGAALERLPARTTFWFAYVAAFPQATVYPAPVVSAG